jgi:hypothetical protein
MRSSGGMVTDYGAARVVNCRNCGIGGERKVSGVRKEKGKTEEMFTPQRHEGHEEHESGEGHAFA